MKIMFAILATLFFLAYLFGERDVDALLLGNILFVGYAILDKLEKK